MQLEKLKCLQTPGPRATRRLGEDPCLLLPSVGDSSTHSAGMRTRVATSSGSLGASLTQTSTGYLEEMFMKCKN